MLMLPAGHWRSKSHMPPLFAALNPRQYRLSRSKALFLVPARVARRLLTGKTGDPLRYDKWLEVIRE